MRRLRQTKQPAEVDIVFTWVNDQDPSWIAARKAHQPQAATADATDTARFRSQDELLYALRGLFRYFDGIGQVFLVTDNQVPRFWTEFADRVHIVDHGDIMSSDVARPTFNSHAIESCLHRIGGLADHYLYLNDDVIIANATGVSDFFNDQGRAKVFYSKTTFVPDGPIVSQTLAADAAAINARKLLARFSGYAVDRKFQHCPIAIRKNVMLELEAQFASEFNAVRQNRFRGQTDIAPSGSLYQNYALMTKQAVTAEITYRYLQVTDRHLPSALLRLGIVTAEKRPAIVCLNAVTGGVGAWWNGFAIRWQMTRLFPPEEGTASEGGLSNTFRRAVFDLLLWAFYRTRSIRR